MAEYLRREEKRRLIQADKAAQLVGRTIPITIGAACFTGLRDILGGQTVLAATLAAGSAIILSAVWGVIFKSVPITIHRDKQAQMVACAAVLTVAGMAFSAWPATTMIGGRSAITEYLSEYEAQSQKALLLAKTLLEKQAGLVDNVQRESSDLATQMQNEITNGAIGDGENGEGPIALALGATADQLHNISIQQKKLLDNAESSISDAQEYIDDMQHIVADASSGNDEREQEFADSAAKFGDALSVIMTTDLLAPLNSFDAAASTYNPPTFAGQQAIHKVDEETQQFVDGLHNKISRLQTNDAQLQPFTPVSAGNAVILFAKDILGAWAITFGLDSLPFLLLLLLINIHRSSMEQYQSPDPWDHPEVLIYPGPPSLDNGERLKPNNNGKVVEFEVKRKKGASGG